MKALTAAEMNEVDRLTTERHGISSSELMKRAGRHVADAVLREFAPGKPPRTVILCGKGNNGGDGLVAARFLKEAGVEIRVCVFWDPAHSSSSSNTFHRREIGDAVSAIKNEADWDKVWPLVADSDVVVDALLGTGLRGPATGLLARAIEDVNRLSRNATAPRPVFILAVDTPSGLPSDGGKAEGPVLFAHRTVTFTAPKIGQLVSANAPAIGKLEVREIGSPQNLIEEVGKGTVRWAEPLEFLNLPLVRAADSNKGTYGHVLLVAGSFGKSGAAILGGRAALRSGAGLVTIATVEKSLNVVANGEPEFMTEPLEETSAGTIALRNIASGRFAQVERGKAVLAIGPGMGLLAETQEFIRHVVQQTEPPVILDADGLNAFSEDGDLLRIRKTKFLAITPHPGEMARLAGCDTKQVQSDRIGMAAAGARRWNAHVVLKGFHTIIASPEGQIFVATTGNAGLAKGGTGDSLTGILAALTAQFKTEDWARVLAMGVYLHGLAAEIACVGTDQSGLLAGELATAMPHARAQLLRELQRRG